MHEMMGELSMNELFFLLPSFISCSQESDDLLERTKQRRIVTRQDEYHKNMYKSMMISPARLDPFVDGKGLLCYVHV